MPPSPLWCVCVCVCERWTSELMSASRGDDCVLGGFEVYVHVQIYRLLSTICILQICVRVCGQMRAPLNKKKNNGIFFFFFFFSRWPFDTSGCSPIALEACCDVSCSRRKVQISHYYAQWESVFRNLSQKCVCGLYGFLCFRVFTFEFQSLMATFDLFSARAGRENSAGDKELFAARITRVIGF